MSENRLNVIGRANGEIAPDRIEWTLVVREVDQDPRAAFARCGERLRALADALAMATVTTGAVAVFEQRERHEHGLRPTGRHEARAALTASAPLERGGDVAAAAMEGGADELNGPHMRTPDPATAVDALLAEAVHAARRRAERMAGAADRKLGRAITVTDHRLNEDFEYDDVETQAMSRQSRGGGDSSTPVIPRPQRLSVAVAVVFELLD